MSLSAAIVNMQTFFCEADYRSYISLLAEWCRKCHVEIWAYCMMPNHVHLIAVPHTEDTLRCGIGEAHEDAAAWHLGFEGCIEIVEVALDRSLKRGKPGPHGKRK
ncbi:MAG: hypothetical protein Fur0034_07790 [Desulfuromonadia bacterium]